MSSNVLFLHLLIILHIMEFGLVIFVFKKLFWGSSFCCNQKNIPKVLLLFLDDITDCTIHITEGSILFGSLSITDM